MLYTLKPDSKYSTSTLPVTFKGGPRDKFMPKMVKAPSIPRFDLDLNNPISKRIFELGGSWEPGKKPKS